LEDTFSLDVTTSRQYQSQKKQLYLTDLTLTGQRYEFSPIFFGEVDGAVTRASGGETFGTAAIRLGGANY